MKHKTDISKYICGAICFFVCCCKALIDTCPADDFKCKYPNFWKTGKILHGKCQRDNVLRRLQTVSLIGCVTECFVTSSCVGINYRKNWPICDLVGETVSALDKESGCFYSQISSWSKTLAGKCADHKCKAGKKCIWQISGETSCKQSYCTDVPDALNAKCTEKWGLHRDLGQGNIFECNKKFELVGRPFYVCQDDGIWKKLFCCRPVTCADGWKRHNGHWYYFGQENVTWSEAKTKCEEKDSHLVKIDTEKETRFVHSISKNRAWIGANDLENEGEWRWISDNSTVEFKYWNPNEPNDFGQNEDCAEMNTNGRWNDYVCAREQYYICEQDVCF